MPFDRLFLTPITINAIAFPPIGPPEKDRLG